MQTDPQTGLSPTKGSDALQNVRTGKCDDRQGSDPFVGQGTQTAVLLIAHGSRRSAANDDLVQLAQLVADRGGYSMVEVSYLELAEPTIAAAGRRCVERGARRVLMLPYFLSAGVHVVNDMEAERTKLAAEFSQVEFVLCPHLGLHPLMADIVLQRLGEAKVS